MNIMAEDAQNSKPSQKKKNVMFDAKFSIASLSEYRNLFVESQNSAAVFLIVFLYGTPSAAARVAQAAAPGRIGAERRP